MKNNITLPTNAEIETNFGLWLGKQTLPFDDDTNEKVEELLNIAFVNGAKYVRNEAEDKIYRAKL